jgi:RHS repeat-associated protein
MTSPTQQTGPDPRPGESPSETTRSVHVLPRKDDTGATYEYDAFGGIRNAKLFSAQPWRFTGEQQDFNVANDLYYLRARYYDPAIGRFWSRDPLASVQRYAYANGSPSNFIDPYGLFSCGPFGGVCDKIGDAGQCVVNRGDCVTEPIANGAGAVGNAIADAFGPPYTLTKVLQMADLVPLGEACIVVFVATGVGAPVLVGCVAVDIAIGSAAAVATQAHIGHSDCSSGRRTTATLLNVGNLYLDQVGLPYLAGEVGEFTAYVVSSEVLDCGTNDKE